MKELLEGVGIGEIFEYICPGIVFLCSLTIWLDPRFDLPVWSHQFLVIVLGLLLSYTLGFVIASLDYLAQRLSVHVAPQAAKRRIGSLKWLASHAIRLVSRFPVPRYSAAVVEVNVYIAEDLGRLSTPGASNLMSPFDWLLVYRTLKADETGDRHQVLLAEADGFHRRYRFSMRVAMALILLSVESFLRLAGLAIGSKYHVPFLSSWYGLPPMQAAFLLGLITLLGIGISFILREYGIRNWELERWLTASLARPGQTILPNDTEAGQVSAVS